MSSVREELKACFVERERRSYFTVSNLTPLDAGSQPKNYIKKGKL